MEKIRLTKSKCKHEWDIEESTKEHFVLAPNDVDGEGTWQMNGSYSPGVCRKCQERKMFANYVSMSNQLSI